jgi:hypothetical protein
LRVRPRIIARRYTYELSATLAELRDVLADNRRALGRDRQG